MKREHLLHFSILLLLIFSSTSCVKDQPELLKPELPPATLDSGKVMVVNEGNFGSGNASLSLFNRYSGALSEDYFKSVNGFGLGDVAQSMYRYGDYYYIVVNNSGKILICDLKLKQLALIQGLSSPRHMAFNGNKAYVSDFKSGEIHVLDLLSKSKIGKIPCAGWTEDLVLIDSMLYASNVFSNYLYLVDTGKDQIKDSIWVGLNVTGLQADQNKKLWILSAGKTGSNPPALSCFDPQNRQLQQKLSFQDGQYPFDLCRNGRGDSLYFINGDVFAFPVSSQANAAALLVKAQQQNFYGLGIHPRSSEIYVSDALDYIQRSQISIYSSSGKVLGEFKAGINAGGFFFE